MTQAAPRTSSRPARDDATARQAIVVACLALTAIVVLDLVDGRLGLLYSVGFVLIVVTAPMSVHVRHLLPTGVLPPLLLVASLLVVAVAEPSAIRVDGLASDASLVARMIAATIDHGLTLLVGHGLVLAIICWRILTDPHTDRRARPSR